MIAVRVAVAAVMVIGNGVMIVGNRIVLVIEGPMAVTKNESNCAVTCLREFFFQPDPPYNYIQ